MMSKEHTFDNFPKSTTYQPEAQAKENVPLRLRFRLVLDVAADKLGNCFLGVRKKLFTAACSLVACFALTLSAQEIPPRQPVPAPLGVINDVDVLITNVTLEKLDNPPARKIEFERATEAVKQKLYRPDPKLLEQKYVAIVRLNPPSKRTATATANFNPRDDKDAFPLQLWGLFNLFRSAETQFNFTDPPSVCLNRMLKHIPEDRRPAAEEIAFFTSPEVDREYVVYGIERIAPPNQRTVSGFRILAASPEQAEQRAATLLTLLDQGVSRPIQTLLFKKRGPLEDKLRANRKTLVAKEAELIDWERQLIAFADFTPEMLPGLRVQQLQLEVDLAGVKARIAACERLLGQAGIQPERQQQLEDAKIAAEIELSGFEARRAKSEEFVGKVKRKVELVGKQQQAKADRDNLVGNIRVVERQIGNLDHEIQTYSPLPLVEGKVIIAPLEWTE